jgi:NADPH:quinone reductase-like Zn-dependent oxidoreductase
MGGRADFDTVMNHIFAHTLTPTIDSVLPLAAVEQGLSSLEDALQFGKIVIDPQKQDESPQHERNTPK